VAAPNACASGAKAAAAAWERSEPGAAAVAARPADAGAIFSERAGREADLPRIGLEVADDGLEQRGLPRPVPPDQAEPPPGVEGHIRPFHQGAAADAEREVAEGEDGHARPL
jgi:predicted dienelactone hydrolase